MRSGSGKRGKNNVPPKTNALRDVGQSVGGGGERKRSRGEEEDTGLNEIHTYIHTYMHIYRIGEEYYILDPFLSILSIRFDSSLVEKRLPPVPFFGGYSSV